MKLYKRVLKLHQFRNLGKKSPTGLLLIQVLKSMESW